MCAHLHNNYTLLLRVDKNVHAVHSAAFCQVFLTNLIVRGIPASLKQIRSCFHMARASMGDTNFTEGHKNQGV